MIGDENESPAPQGPGNPGNAAESDLELPSEIRALLPEREPVALQAFFDLYFDRIYGYVRRLVRDTHLAEDLTQDVFLHVQRAFHTYDAQRPLRPWVFTIATNKLRDHWRSARHRESQKEEDFESEGLAERLASSSDTALGDLSDREMADLLHKAVEELPDGMRMTVHLRVFEGLSFDAIGEVLGRTGVAVRKRYSRALEVLRGGLGQAWQIHSEGS